MYKNARKSLMVVCFLLILVMPFMIAASPGQVEEPGDGGEGTALDLLAPIGDAISNVVVIVVALAIFLFGTVQGTQFAKIFLPKGGWEWWQNARPYVIRGVSVIFAIWAMVGLNFDAFGILAEINESFDVDPIFGQLLSGAALSFVSNKYYDKYEDE